MEMFLLIKNSRKSGDDLVARFGEKEMIIMIVVMMMMMISGDQSVPCMIPEMVRQ